MLPVLPTTQHCRHPTTAATTTTASATPAHLRHVGAKDCVERVGPGRRAARLPGGDPPAPRAAHRQVHGALPRVVAEARPGAPSLPIVAVAVQPRPYPHRDPDRPLLAAGRRGARARAGAGRRTGVVHPEEAEGPCIALNHLTCVSSHPLCVCSAAASLPWRPCNPCALRATSASCEMDGWGQVRGHTSSASVELVALVDDARPVHRAGPTRSCA